MSNVVVIGNNSGGMYGFRKDLLERLVEDGNHVTVLTPFDDKVEELERICNEVVEVKIDRRGINPITDLKLLIWFWKYLRKKKPDLIMTYTVKPNVYAGLISRFLHISLAANITGLGTAFQGQGMLRKMITKLYKVSLKKAKVVFFENDANRQLFVDEHIIGEEQTCLLMGAGVNLEDYQYVEYPENQKVKFLFMGRVMQEKGINELLDAMRRLIADGIPAELDVLGNYEENYETMIEQCEREGWLHYHGYQSDVRPYIAQADCFVLPSWHEGMANTNLECAAMGRPIITSDIAGCREAVVDGVSGLLFACRNSDSLYEKMRLFCGYSRDEKEKMGINGRKHMEEVFDKKKVVEKTVGRL